MHISLHKLTHTHTHSGSSTPEILCRSFAGIVGHTKKGVIKLNSFKSRVCACACDTMLLLRMHSRTRFHVAGAPRRTAHSHMCGSSFRIYADVFFFVLVCAEPVGHINSSVCRRGPESSARSARHQSNIFIESCGAPDSTHTHTHMHLSRKPVATHEKRTNESKVKYLRMHSLWQLPWCARTNAPELEVNVFIVAPMLQSTSAAAAAVAAPASASSPRLETPYWHTHTHMVSLFPSHSARQPCRS